MQYNSAIIKKKYLKIPNDEISDLAWLDEKKVFIKRRIKKNRNKKKIFLYFIKKPLSKNETKIKLITIKKAVMFSAAFPIINDIGIK